MKKVVKIIRNIITFVIGIVIIYAIVGNLSAQNVTLYNIVKFRNYVVLTGSMEPGISPGDYITVRKINPDNVREGDIISYMLNGSVVTHKVVKVEGSLITTQGTANNIADEPINKSSVIGKYMFKLGKVGYIMAFFSSKSGLILVFGLIGIMIFWDLSDPEKNAKTKNNNDKKEMDKGAALKEIIIESLSEMGVAPKELIDKINSESDEDILKKLSKKSTRVNSIEEFSKVYIEKENEPEPETNKIEDPYHVPAGSRRSRRNK